LGVLLTKGQNQGRGEILRIAIDDSPQTNQSIVEKCWPCLVYEAGCQPDTSLRLQSQFHQG